MKKFKNFFKRLLMRKLVVKTNTTNQLHVIEVNLKADNLVDSLGMTEDRAKELFDIVKNEYDKHVCIVTTMEIVSKQCKHANELYFMSMAINHIHTQRSSIGSVLSAILGGPRH